MKKKIFPIDWKAIHPGHAAMSTDSYYTKLANEVLNVLEDSGIKEVLETDVAIRDAAVRITAWFEDICLGGGPWGVVNSVCQQRHGKPLPFYDTTEYTPGEPNPQDIMLLLWDIIQSHHDYRIVNPENQGIVMAAYDIYNILYDEYESAPDTEEMLDFFANPDLETDYWQARKAMEWFAMDSYLSLRTRIRFEESKPEGRKDEYYNIRVYHSMLAHTFNDTHNLLALTASEWLSTVTGHRMDLDKTLMQQRVYDIVSRDGDTVLLRDILNGNKVSIETDSLDSNWVKQYLPSAKRVACNIIGFNGKNYHFGAMFTDPGKDYMEKYKEQQMQEERRKENVAYTASLFPKASGGKPIVFVRGIDEYMDFNTKKMGSKATDGFRREMERCLRENAESGMAAFMSDDKEGLLTIFSSIPAIKAPNNPYYDEKYAQRNALNLVVMPSFIDYSALCTLIELNYLPDAALTSRQGYEHGRDIVQKNIQFLADYFFAQHR